MYAWRSTSDKNNSGSGSSGRAFVFNPITGARCAQRVLYNPQPTQRDLDVVRGGRGRDTKHSAAGDDDGDSWSSEGEEEEENEGGPIWDSAAGPGGDRRRHWQQTNFNFSPHHFHKQRRVGSTDAAITTATSHGAAVYVPYIHDTILLCSPSRYRQQAADVTQDREAVQRRRRSSTRVVLAVTCNAAEARAREVQAATEAKNGELLSMSTFSPGPRVARRKSYNGASSPTHCFKEADASSVAAGATTAAASAVGAVRSSLTGAPPAATTDGVARPFVESLGEDLSTPGDTRLGQSGGAAPLRRSYGKSAGAAAAAAAAAAAPATTTAADAGVSSSAIVGSTLASRQRVLSMAEGVYRDLVMGEAQRTGTVFGSATSLRMASVPTCELAYTLRASYMQGSHGKSSGGIGDKAGATASRNELPRSATYDTTASLPSRMAVSTGGSSSVLGRSAPSGTSQRPHPPRRQPSGNPPRPRPASANTAMSSSGMQGSSVYDPAPHRRTVTAVGINGHVGSSFFEEVGDEDEEVDAEGAATEARLQEIPAVAVSAGGDAAQTAQGDAAPKRASLPNPTPPPPLPTLAVKRIPSDRSLTSSSDVVSRTMSAASPLGGDGATMAGSAHLTAPPTLSRFALEHALLHNEGGAALRSTRRSSPLRTRRRRSSRFTVSPTSDTYCEPPPHPTPPQQQQQQQRHTHVADSISAGTQAVAEGSQSTNNDGAHRGNHHGSKHSHRPRRRPHTSQQRTGSRRAGSSQHRRGQSTRSAHETQHSDGGNDTSATARLPSDAKETRVYAVRMRTTFTNADASVTQRQWRDPPRRGVPVLLPEDWQIST